MAVSRSIKLSIFKETVSWAAYYSTSALERRSLAPKVERGLSKLFKSADEAVADIKSGSTILSSGFGLCGVAGIFCFSFAWSILCARSLALSVEI